MDVSLECTSFIFNSCFEPAQYKYSIFVPLIVFFALMGTSSFFVARLDGIATSDSREQRVVSLFLASAFSSAFLIIPLIVFSEPINFLVSLGIFFYLSFFLYKKIYSHPILLSKAKTFMSADVNALVHAAKTQKEPILDTPASSDELDTHVSFFEEFIMNKATLFFLALLAFGIGLVVFL